MWAALSAQSLVSHFLGIGQPIGLTELQFALELYAYAAIASAAGLAAMRCASMLRALCAIPIALVLALIIPGEVGIWLSVSFHSVTLNMLAAAALYVAAGVVAGLLVNRISIRYA